MIEIDLDDIMTERCSDGSVSIIANIGDLEAQVEMPEVDLEKPLPILPVKNIMLFPGTLLPVTISRKASLRLINDAAKKELPIGVFSQINDETNEPGINDVYHTGVLAKVVRIIHLPDNTHTAFIQGFSRVRLIELFETTKYLTGRVEMYPEIEPEEKDKAYRAMFDSCIETAIKYMRIDRGLSGMTFALNNMTNRQMAINFICSNFPIDNRERIVLLEKTYIYDRCQELLAILQRELQFATMKIDIQTKTREKLDKQQREYFLRQEIEKIQEALGEKSSHHFVDNLRKRAADKKWPKDVENFFNQQLEKLSTENEQSIDFQLNSAYLETIVDLPWDEYTKDNLNLANAEKVLNKHHYGMEKVKERILEHLAVLKMRGDFKSPIICLYGPPGVGKTSLGKSIAQAMKRKYVRVSLGGVHDEAEIRGHRRTYVGSMPGRIIASIKKAGSSNPVFILDEIDKVGGMSNHGDPASALLEVLDPEQNAAFHDNYLDLDYDLSKVMFIATANNVADIPSPLLDRMELIEVSGYLTEEKMEIARRHLIPNALENLAMQDKGIRISKPAIEKIIEDYTRESGVRTLDKKVTELLRKITLEYAKNETLPDHDIKASEVKNYLGTEIYQRDKYEGNAVCGVVTGLAWTSVGGEILYIETSINESKQPALSLTGNLGDVMKESATIALQYLKANTDLLGEPPALPKWAIAKDAEPAAPSWTDFFSTHAIHIHVPEGATPKDGPSAGITIATSIASAITGRKVRKRIAMTGEITLRGKVLPIGGVKEKILAAKRAGITDILCCEENRRNVEEIPEIYVQGLIFHYVKTVRDVLDFALI